MRLSILHNCPRGTILLLGCPRIRLRLPVTLVSEGERCCPGALVSGCARASGSHSLQTLYPASANPHLCSWPFPLSVPLDLSMRKPRPVCV